MEQEWRLSPKNYDNIGLFAFLRARSPKNDRSRNGRTTILSTHNFGRFPAEYFSHATGYLLHVVYSTTMRRNGTRNDRLGRVSLSTHRLSACSVSLIRLGQSSYRVHTRLDEMHPSRFFPSTTLVSHRTDLAQHGLCCPAFL